MRRRLSILALSVLCLGATAAPAGPDMFGFSYANVRSTFDGVSSFNTTHWAETFGHVYRNPEPVGTALFLPGAWSGAESFSISMAISDITPTSAVGTGSFSITDVHGDAITGLLSGTWAKEALNTAVFIGSMTDVSYLSVADATFDGHLGSVSMSFPDRIEPWSGVLTQLTAPNGWFMDAAGVPRTFDFKGGSVDAIVNAPVIPAPGALCLALFGVINAAGWRRHRFA